MFLVATESVLYSCRDRKIICHDMVSSWACTTMLRERPRYACDSNARTIELGQVGSSCVVTERFHAVIELAHPVSR